MPTKTRLPSLLSAFLALPLLAAPAASADRGTPAADKAKVAADKADKRDFQRLRAALQSATKSGDQAAVKKIDHAVVTALEAEAREQRGEVKGAKLERASSAGEVGQSRREAVRTTRAGRPVAGKDDRRDLRDDRRDLKDDRRDVAAAQGEANAAAGLLARYRGLMGRFDNQSLHERDQILERAVGFQRHEVKAGKREVREDKRERREDVKERREDRRDVRKKAR